MRSITYRQMRAVDFWLGNGRKSKARAVREAGYSEAIARQPHKVFDSPAVIKELEKRGYNPIGMYKGNSKPKVMSPPIAVQHKHPSEAFIFNEESLIELKARLEEVELRSVNSTEDRPPVKNYFGEPENTSNSDSISSFSSM